VNFQKAVNQQQAGTGRWFLESEQFSTWKTDAASFLWLYGIPGCGKTILSSTILQTIFEYCQEDIVKTVAYFFFDFTDPKKQDAKLMIFSLISQLPNNTLRFQLCLKRSIPRVGKEENVRH
jgi:DNA replication protein DnaC